MPQVVLCAVRTTALIFRHFFQYFIQPRIICSKACLSKRKQEPFQVALRSLYAHKKSHPAWVLETQAQLMLGDFYGNKRICPKPSFYFAFVLTIFLFQLKKKKNHIVLLRYTICTTRWIFMYVYTGVAITQVKM